LKKAEFEQLVANGYFSWASNRDRRPSVWFLSLMEWAEEEYIKAYRKEQSQVGK
jgi:hypothetical protein